jgi:hypothetical protein
VETGSGLRAYCTDVGCTSSEALVSSVTSILPVSEIEPPRLPPLGVKLSASAHALLLSVTGAQLVMSIGIGAMKSFS